MTILVIANDTFSLIKLRLDMLKAFIGQKNRVIILAPDSEYQGELENYGMTFIEVPYKRTGLNPFSDLMLYARYKKIIAQNKPDCVFAYNLKPIVYGVNAAHDVGITSLFAMIPGAGYLFSNIDIKSRVIYRLILPFYKRALCFCHKVFFQNPNDLNEFLHFRFVNAEQTVQVNGSGVNTKQFNQCELPQQCSFIFIARLLKVKGIEEYCQAAKIVKHKYPDIGFMVVGGMDSNPTCIPAKKLEDYISQGVITYAGRVDNVQDYLKAASVFVLPSYHREGVPHATLEAMSMGRAIITTDEIGCRETIEDGINGKIVRKKDPQDLAEKMVWMIEHYEDVLHMGNESRRICLEKFDVDMVNGIIMDTMGLKNE